MDKRWFKLDEICKIKSGKRIPKGMDYVTFQTSHPYIRARDIKSGNIFTEDLIYLEDCVYQKIKKYIIQEGDIAITIAGSIGETAYAKKNVDGYNLTENAVRLTNFTKDVDSKYLHHVLAQKQYHDYMQLISGAAAQPKLGLYKIKRIRVALPKISIQKKIADILSTYDNLIENNNKRIKLLEQMAENLYKEWFVRFRFPGYKDVEFENGIPNGWEEVRLGEFIDLKSGYAFKSDWWTDEGVPVIKIKDIQDGKIDLTTLDYVSQENAQKAKKFYVGKGDILIALIGATIGKVGIVTRDNVLVNQRVGKFFIEKPSIKNIGYIYNLFKQNWIQQLIVMYSGSNAAQPNISPIDIGKFRIIYNKVYVDKFNVTVYPIYDSIIKLYDKNDVLIKQRDLLLPRLMSGKLEV